MDLLRRLGKLFSSEGAREQAAEREEYGSAGLGELEAERARSQRYAGTRAAEVVEGELEELEPPDDPAP